MRKLVIASRLVWVRILRFWLVLLSAITALKLGLPLRYASFPLLPLISWQATSLHPKISECDTQLLKSVDVIISLYKFEKYKSVLEESLKSCFANPKITFHFVLVSGTRVEIDWLNAQVKNSHHSAHLVDNRIGIYAAWNIAIQSGRGDFITNMNADDLRLPHSLCGQALDLQLTSADGSFGNFILSDNILADLNSKSTRWLASKLGIFDSRKLVVESQNFMHCAPMWKRNLHVRNGLFDEALQSSGDTDFWLRCMERGARFIPYLPETVVYFHNPEGLSTSTASAGHREWTRIRDSHIRKQQAIRK